MDGKGGGNSSGSAALGLGEQLGRESTHWAVIGWWGCLLCWGLGDSARSYLASANAALPSTHVEVVDVPMQPLATVAELVRDNLDLGLLQDIST